jgi:hypothetical protein
MRNTMKISISWKDLELDETGACNEGLLADIRKKLKEAERRSGPEGKPCISPPAEDAPELELRLDGESVPPWVREKFRGFAEDTALQDRFLDAAAHCGRRLKNCGIEKWTLSCSGEVPKAFTRRLAERLDPYFSPFGPVLPA